nr:hypothetical protein [Legionella jordanis]
MKLWFAGLSLLMLSNLASAVEYKIFWNCQDHHDEALELTVKNDKKINLFINYLSEGNKEIASTAIDVKSLVNLPDNFNQDKFVILGDDQKLYLNCIGQVVPDPKYPQGIIEFNVRTHAYQCPFIPKGC